MRWNPANSQQNQETEINTEKKWGEKTPSQHEYWTSAPFGGVERHDECVQIILFTFLSDSRLIDATADDDSHEKYLFYYTYVVFIILFLSKERLSLNLQAVKILSLQFVHRAQH